MPERPLGRLQLDCLLTLGSPRWIMLSPPDRPTRSLISRGLVAKHERGGWRITPEVLEALARELRSGRVDEHIATEAERLKKKRERPDA